MTAENNTTSTETRGRLSPYELNHPVAALLFEFNEQLSPRHKATSRKPNREAMAIMADNAVEASTRWIEAVTYLMYSICQEGALHEKTAYAVANCADLVGALACISEQLREIEHSTNQQEEL